MPEIDQLTRAYVESSQRVIESLENEIKEIRTENVILRLRLQDAQAINPLRSSGRSWGCISVKGGCHVSQYCVTFHRGCFYCSLRRSEMR